MTGLNRMALHSSEFAVTTKKKINPSLSVTGQHYRCVNENLFFEAPGIAFYSP